MLTYTFSTREKIMLAVLAFVGVIVLWYQLIFVNIQNQVNSINSQIAAAQDQLIVTQSKTASLSKMREVVEQYKAQGVEPVLMPAFDNTQSLMAYLNGVLAGTRSYSMTFDNPSLSDSDNTVHRSGTLAFTTGSYDEARAVVWSVAKGPYPCQVDALGITDGSASGNGDATVSTTLQVTFFEKPAGNVTTTSSGTSVQGQDLSQMSNWNK